MGPVQRRLYGLPDLGGVAYRDLARVLERPWFTRMWIVQEVAVSRAARRGDHEADWDDFSAALNCLPDIFLPLSYDNTSKIQKVAPPQGARAAARNA